MSDLLTSDFLVKGLFEALSHCASLHPDATSSDDSMSEEDEDGEEWAVGLRRSVERTLVPQRGILKNARNYDQHVFLERADPGAPAGLRGRANSYQADHEAAPGALAHMPSNANDPVRTPSVFWLHMTDSVCRITSTA